MVHNLDRLHADKLSATIWHKLDKYMQHFLWPWTRKAPFCLQHNIFNFLDEQNIFEKVAPDF